MDHLQRQRTFQELVAGRIDHAHPPSPIFRMIAKCPTRVGVASYVISVEEEAETFAGSHEPVETRAQPSTAHVTARLFVVGCARLGAPRITHLLNRPHRLISYALRLLRGTTTASNAIRMFARLALMLF